MAEFSYHAPHSAEEAVGLLFADPEAKVLAGGSDLIMQIRSGRIAPSAVVDLKRIPGIADIRDHEGGFAIGAAAPCTALKEHPALVAAWPGVVEAANLIGSVQVRNRASLVGNLCNASPAADSVPALVAANATCLIVGPHGEREAPVGTIPAAPGRTTLGPGEFIREVRLPARPAGGGDAYLRTTPRTEMDIAVVGAGVALVLDKAGTCTAARVALGAVAPTVMLVPAAGAALVGTKLDEAALAAMADAVRAACQPIDDKRGTAAYRTDVAAVLAGRVAEIARQRAGDAA